MCFKHTEQYSLEKLVSVLYELYNFTFAYPQYALKNNNFMELLTKKLVMIENSDDKYIVEEYGFNIDLIKQKILKIYDINL